MSESLGHALKHVLWIGGATDSGKTTIADILAQRYGLQVYHYDRRDIAHHQRLAETIADYRAAMSATLDEYWVQPEPEDLVQRSLRSFQDRFPLVIEDLQALAKTPTIIAEGFGLTPDLLFPLLTTPQQAIFLVPDEGFKWASMARRNKPSFMYETSNPERAKQNLFQRDVRLAEIIRAQAQAHNLICHEVDEAQSLEDVTAVVESHFGELLM